MRRQLLASGAAVSTALVVGLAMTVLPAVATHVTPTPIDDNITCAAEAPEGETWLELKVDPVVGGTFTSADGLLEVTITITETNDEDEPTVFDWTSNIGVDAVFAKGGSGGGNLYLYDPEATEDTGLHAPETGGSGKFAGLSHISFCYDKDRDESPSSPPPTNGDGNGKDDENGEEKPESPAPVPTDVPAGANAAGGGSGGLIGLILAASAAVAGAVVLAGRRFLHDS
jgi:hypothetical protein